MTKFKAKQKNVLRNSKKKQKNNSKNRKNCVCKGCNKSFMTVDRLRQHLNAVKKWKKKNVVMSA